MLEIKDIKKSYRTGDFIQHALKGVTVKFRKNEFVAILGASGSGKTTLLNILGGLDRYGSGDLLINNLSTKKFKDKDWDAYRNNCVGFIFQSYNLISHISLLQNIEMSMTLSNVKKSTRKKKALEVLDKVGLKDHAHKKPNQLSGGQMQRVAIARALVNDPDIILADEPTGALDTKTSEQIMNLIKEIAKDKLVIMVTHNREIAKEYASRIIELKDGEVVKDSKPFDKSDKDAKITIKKTKMNYLTALALSFNNILTKKGRTFITSLASSIGIIGIALILALSNGFDIQIKDFERNSLANMPIVISTEATDMSPEAMMELQAEQEKMEEFTSENIIIPKEDTYESITHKNIFTDEYMEYISNLDNDQVDGIQYTRTLSLNLVNKIDNEVKVFTDKSYFSSLPSKLDGSNTHVEDNFELLAGNLPTNNHELLLVLDLNNTIPEKLLELMGIETTENLKFEDLIGQEFKIILNDNYYQKVGSIYTPKQDLTSEYNNDENITLTISGIIRSNEGNILYENFSGIVYNEGLAEEIISDSKNSEVVKAQQNADYNVLYGEPFEEEGYFTKDIALANLGDDTYPYAIQIFPKDFESKDYILEELDKYNEGLDEEDMIVYTDMGAMISSLSSSIMDAITIVLIAFSAISLIVSSIMIGIITYISVLERTKEIGILRSLGARKKDITRVFNAETSLIGLFSGLLGIFIAWLLTFPANILIENATELPDVAVLNPIHCLILIAVSLTLTVLGGLIPAKMASKKDPVIALRTE